MEREFDVTPSYLNTLYPHYTKACEAVPAYFQNGLEHLTLDGYSMVVQVSIVMHARTAAAWPPLRPVPSATLCHCCRSRLPMT